MRRGRRTATSRGDEHGAKHRVTPDGRYFAVRGRLWRTSKPTLAPEHRDKLVQERDARGAPEKLAQAGAAVDAAEVTLGERGPLWWTNGARDYNRKMARSTPHAEWFEEMSKP